MVLNVPTPLSAGIPGNSIPQNIGTMENRGIELSVDDCTVFDEQRFQSGM